MKCRVTLYFNGLVVIMSCGLCFFFLFRLFVWFVLLFFFGGGAIVQALKQVDTWIVSTKV